MEGKQYTFKLGFDKTKEKTTNMIFVQGDTNTYYLKIQLIRNNKPFNLEGAGVVSINFIKPDNERVIGKVEIIDRANGIILYKMGTQEIMVQGMCSAEVQIYGLETKRITTSTFQYYVRSEFVQDEWIESTTEYPIMTQIMAELSTITVSEEERIKNENIRQIQENQRVQADTNRESRTNTKIKELNEIQQQTNNKMDEIENRFTNLTTSQQQDSEVIDARKGKTSLRKKIDEIDVSIENKVDKALGKQLSTEDYTTEEKNKLANIEEGANNYKLPDILPANMISEDNTKKFVSDVEKANWNSKETLEGAQDKADQAEQNAKQYTDTEIEKSKQYTNTEIEKVNNKIDKPLYSTPVETYNNIISLPNNTTNGQISCVVRGLTATNIVENGDFSEGTIAWGSFAGTIVTGDKVLIGTAKGSASNMVIFQDIRDVIIPDQEWYLRAVVKVTNPYCDSIILHLRGSAGGVAGDKISSPNENQWYDFSVVTKETTSISGGLRVGIDPRYADAEAANGQEIYVKQVIAINLTRTFGAGNEPTKEECDKIFANYLDGTKSTPAAMKVKSVGKNLLDGELENGGIHSSDGNAVNIEGHTRTGFIKVNSEEVYTVTHPSMQYSTFCYMSDKTFIGRVYNGMSLPSSTSYIRCDFKSIDLNANVQIERGSTATEYEPYKESTAYVVAKDKDNKIVNLNRVGDVADEIDLDKGKVIKRTKEIFLDGSENWGLQREDLEKVYAFGLTLNDSEEMAKGHLTINDISFKFVQNWHLDEEHFYFTLTGNLVVYVSKSTIDVQEGDNTTAKFKNWLKEGILIYQLAEPEHIPIEIEGELQSYENGTVYFTPYIKDRFEVDSTKLIELQYPIKAIDKLLKLDTANAKWIEVEGVLSEDGQTITVNEEGTYKVYGEIQEGYSTNGLKRIVTNINLNAQINSNTTAIEKINNKIYTDADLFTAMLLQQEVRITALERGGVI